jgi:hypothetical protein
MDEHMRFSGVSRSLRSVCFVVVVSVVFVAAPATAQVTTNFLGVIDGTEPTFVSPYCSMEPNNYQVVGPLTPSISGSYGYEDLSIYYALDMQIDVYTGSFDPGNPSVNFYGGWDDLGIVPLTTGTDYYFVVSPLCGVMGTGTWEFELNGPGSVEAALLANIPTLGPLSMAILVILLGILGTALLRGYRW